MSWIVDGIAEWLKQLLIDAIMSSFTGMFDSVNEQVGDIAVQVGRSPESWNSNVFTMVRTLSETVVTPIAGFVLTFIMCYELINMVIERNNMAEVVCYKGRYRNAT